VARRARERAAQADTPGSRRQRGGRILGGAFVGFLIYRLLTMDSGDASSDALVRVGVIGVAAGVYIAVVTADVYAFIARMAGSSRAVVLVSLVVGPIVAIAAYMAVFTAAGPPTGS
jgi:uncharacterized membrane protein